MKKFVALSILCFAMVSTIMAQTSNPQRYTLGESLKLSYSPSQPELRLPSLGAWEFQPLRSAFTKRQSTIDLYFGSRNDPFRTWQGRRVGFQEAFGAAFRNDRLSFELSTGSTSAGGMSNIGFEIRW